MSTDQHAWCKTSSRLVVMELSNVLGAEVLRRSVISFDLQTNTLRDHQLCASDDSLIL